MKLEKLIEAYGLADSFTNGSKQQSIKRIFFQNLAALEGNAYDAYPALSREDAKGIIQSLYQRIPRYHGRPEGFLKWARNFAQAQAGRFEFTASVLGNAKFRGAIRNGVRDGLASSLTMDAAVSAEDVVNEVYALIFQMADELAEPCRTATFATRLRKLARKHAYSYHTAKRNNRFRVVSEHLEQCGELGCEYLSQMELASMREDEFDEIAA